MSEALEFSWNQISTGSRVIKSITTPIFPANCPIGALSKLSNFLKIASSVDPSQIQIWSNLVRAVLMRLHGRGTRPKRIAN
jgi:hypothetical protein